LLTDPCACVDSLSYILDINQMSEPLVSEEYPTVKLTHVAGRSYRKVVIAPPRAAKRRGPAKKPGAAAAPVEEASPVSNDPHTGLREESLLDGPATHHATRRAGALAGRKAADGSLSSSSHNDDSGRSVPPGEEERDEHQLPITYDDMTQKYTLRWYINPAYYPHIVGRERKTLQQIARDTK
jgi:hypothetical protein